MQLVYVHVCMRVCCVAVHVSSTTYNRRKGVQRIFVWLRGRTQTHTKPPHHTSRKAKQQAQRAAQLAHNTQSRVQRRQQQGRACVCGEQRLYSSNNSLAVPPWQWTWTARTGSSLAWVPGGQLAWTCPRRTPAAARTLSTIIRAKCSNTNSTTTITWAAACLPGWSWSTASMA
jgi:hypothetical protein